MDKNIKYWLLKRYIKQVSDIYGGDKGWWLRNYAEDVIKNHHNDDLIDIAIQCFKEIYDKKTVKSVMIAP